MVIQVTVVMQVIVVANTGNSGNANTADRLHVFVENTIKP